MNVIQNMVILFFKTLKTAVYFYFTYQTGRKNESENKKTQKAAIVENSGAPPVQSKPFCSHVSTCCESARGITGWHFQYYSYYEYVVEKIRRVTGVCDICVHQCHIVKNQTRQSFDRFPGVFCGRQVEMAEHQIERF